MTKQKWRGIKTTSRRKYEKKPRTITNRLGQKSISLPRITNDKQWAGFPGLSGWAEEIAKMIPNSSFVIVEPFAGAAKVYQEFMRLWPDNNLDFVLNDTSKFVRKWLRENFANVHITGEDFVKCIKRWDSKHTFFLIDKPWSKSYYLQDFASFNRDSVGQYDKEILKICKKIKGKFIIASRKENKLMLNSGYNHKLIKSKYVLSGHYPKLLITTNLRLR